MGVVAEGFPARKRVAATDAGRPGPKSLSPRGVQSLVFFKSTAKPRGRFDGKWHLPGEGQECLIAGNERLGFSPAGKDQEFLIMGIATARKPRVLGARRVDRLGEGEVDAEERLEILLRQAEFGVGENTQQLLGARRVDER